MEYPVSRDSASCEEALQNAKLLYLKLGRVWCPTLKDFVIFNSIGFRHLMRKRGKRRREDEQMRRFALLVHAKNIVADPKATFIHREKETFMVSKWHGKKAGKTTKADFWAIKSQRTNHSVTLLVRQLKKGQKHFFSIY
ncbi:MAG: hypothetical protein ABSE18_00355 [Minisyncoccia bacterium]|jgi:hypothetical protein